MHTPHITVATVQLVKQYSYFIVCGKTLLGNFDEFCEWCTICQFSSPICSKVHVPKRIVYGIVTK